jgi:hypothetical protein
MSMHDGWTYVLAAYVAAAAIFVVWFWMILMKLRRTAPATAGEREPIEVQERAHG